MHRELEYVLGQVLEVGLVGKTGDHARVGSDALRVRVGRIAVVAARRLERLLVALERTLALALIVHGQVDYKVSREVDGGVVG